MKYSGYSEQDNKAMDIAKPLTPVSERQYPGRIAPVGIPDLGCPAIKCIRRVGHDGQHWPT